MPHLALLLHEALGARLGHLLALCRAPGWQGDPEALHQVRIASRRVRAVLDLTDPGIYPGFRKHKRRLRDLTRALGLTRELDVHAIGLEQLKDRHPLHRATVEHLLEGLDQDRRKSRRAMARALGKVSLKGLDQLLEGPVTVGDPAEGSLPAVWNCLEPWVRAVEEHLPPLLDQENITGMHLLRIQVKRLRYTLEILAPAFPAPLEPCLQDLKELQGTLGQHHDQALLEAHLWEAHATLAAHGRDTLASGVLALLEGVAEARRSHFEHFRTLGEGYRQLSIGLKQALEERSGGPE